MGAGLVISGVLLQLSGWASGGGGAGYLGGSAAGAGGQARGREQRYSLEGPHPPVNTGRVQSTVVCAALRRLPLVLPTLGSCRGKAGGKGAES